jgi:3-methylcrotonyl-CoA carboxylase beta subunit
MTSRPSKSPINPLLVRCQEIAQEETVLREGGGKAGQDRQHKHGRLFVRERIEALIDQANGFLEIGLWAAHGMYAEWGQFPGAGVVCGIADISGRPCMIIANDATVKAGAFVPMTCKKVQSADRLPRRFRGSVSAHAG